MKGDETMTAVAFRDSGSMSVMEIGMVMLLMRRGSAALEDFADTFSVQFKTPVSVDDLRPCYTRMLERRWIEAHPTEPPRMLVTSAGEDLTFAAFAGFVRLVDPGGQYFKASIIFGMSTRQRAEDDDG